MKYKSLGFIKKNMLLIMNMIISLLISFTLFPKGYMALKSDLGYEFEHQRPQTSETKPTDIAQRTTIQNYRVDAGSHLSLPSASGATDENHDSYYSNESPIHEPKRWNDLDQQTLYEVDYPYRHAAD